MMKNLRMSRKVHEVPRKDNPPLDLSGLRGMGSHDMTPNCGLDNGQQLDVVKKHRAFKEFPLTSTPTPPAEDVDGGHEDGKASHRQRRNEGRGK